MRLIDETLEAWREGERILGELPQASPDYEMARWAVTTLRTLYQGITDPEAPVAPSAEAAHRRTVASMRHVLEHVRRRRDIG